MFRFLAFCCVFFVYNAKSWALLCSEKEWEGCEDIYCMFKKEETSSLCKKYILDAIETGCVNYNNEKDTLECIVTKLSEKPKG